MPVVEAYSAGCNVIGTDAGNLPFVVKPPDPVVPANDPDALAQSIVSLGREVLAGERQLPPGASALVEKHSEASVRTELRAALAELASSSHASALETARSRSSDRCIKEV
jgi:glycosyltransferase involved in cell wall biosynthesis